MTIKFFQYLSNGKPADYGASETTIPGPFPSLGAMKAANRSAGFHYWQKDAIRFFNARASFGTIEGRFFIDSTQFRPSFGPAQPRQYHVKLMQDNGSVCPVALQDAGGEWREFFSSATEARSALRRFLKGAK